MKIDKYKDAVLQKAYGRTSATPQAIDGDQEAIQAAIVSLHNEGLVKILNKGNNRGKVSVINYEITNKGTELVDEGGYKTKRKAKIKGLFLKGIQWLLGGLILAAITAIANKLIHP